MTNTSDLIERRKTIHLYLHESVQTNENIIVNKRKGALFNSIDQANDIDDTVSVTSSVSSVSSISSISSVSSNNDYALFLANLLLHIEKYTNQTVITELDDMLLVKANNVKASYILESNDTIVNVELILIDPNDTVSPEFIEKFILLLYQVVYGVTTTSKSDVSSTGDMAVIITIIVEDQTDLGL
tara:strand:- start:6830 stop:7384 length:555 start_codon:yes stop_codon:yes gene_type:complete